MTGGDMNNIEGNPRPAEGEPRQGSEILNLNEYGALYVRFLLASQAKTQEEADNIINPNKTVSLRRDLKTTDDALEKRNYNLVCEKSSIAERKREWENTPYLEALGKWREQFTVFMNKDKNPQRIRAIRAILSDEDSAEFEKTENFTAEYAENLFNDFCKDGRSDINKFIERVTANLSSSGSKKIYPQYLKAELDDLGWIASGLFGKETASNVVTRLIELESAIRNDTSLVLENLLTNEHIHNRTDDEKKILDALHKGEIPILTPQVQGVPQQEGRVPVPTVPPEGVSPRPAPVTPDEKALPKDKDENPPPPPAPLPNTPRVETAGEKSLEDMNLLQLNAFLNDMLINLPPEEKTALSNKMLEMVNQQMEDMNQGMTQAAIVEAWRDPRKIVRLYIVNLQKILEERGLSSSLQPAPVGGLAPQPDTVSESVSPKEKTLDETEGIGEIYIDKELITWRDGKHEIRIEKSNESWSIRVFINNRYLDTKHGLLPEELDVRSVLMSLTADIKFGNDIAEKIYQSLAKRFSDGLKENDQIFLDLLKEFPDLSYVYSPNGTAIFTVVKLRSSSNISIYKGWGYLVGASLNEDEIKALDPTQTALLNSSIGKSLLEAWIKGSSTPTSPKIAEQSVVGSAGPTVDKAVASPEDIIDMENMSPVASRIFLNEQLKASNQDHRTFNFSPEQLKEFIIPMIKSKVQGGTARVDEDNKIIIEGIQISRSLGRKVTLDLIIQNADLDFLPFERKHIMARVQDNKTGRGALDKLPQQAQFIVTDIGTAVKDHLNGMMPTDNSSWSTNDISIEDGKVLVRFEKRLLSAP